MGILEPLEEPRDPYGLNHEWPTGWVNHLILVLSLIPVWGLGTAIGSGIYYYMERDSNRFNIAEGARKDVLFSVAVQMLWLVVCVVWVIA